MARTSNITFAQVAQIADTMKAAGTRPTARAVRERIGSGSMGTIHKLLQQWAGKATTNDDQDDAPELPSSIATALMEFVSTQIAEACEPINNALQHRIDEAKALAEENERLEGIITAITEERDTYKTDAHAARSVQHVMQDERNDAKAELTGLRELVAELRRELDRSKRQTEMLASLQPDLVDARTALNNSEMSRNESERQNAILAERCNALAARCEDLEKRLEASEKREAATASELKITSTALAKCTAELSSTARELAEKATRTTPAKTTKKPAAKKPANQELNV